ncbi:glucose-1-phosphate cytidylyltransferase [Rhodopseudomonas palustris]
MKAVILAGGLGSRLAEETEIKPKPMVEIGGKPILLHIMRMYSAHGINDFIICLGYKGYVIKEYFSNYALHMSDVTIDFSNQKMEVHQSFAEPWRVTLVETGEKSMTGGRLRRVKKYLDPEEPFCFTYGDGVSDVDIGRLIHFHKSHGKLATVTAVQPPGRFGSMEMEDNRVFNFLEKPRGDGGWINGGFFVLQPKAVDYIEDDETIWEQGPLRKLASDGELMAYQHDGFWQPMDTLRDKQLLEALWSSGSAPWKFR